MKTRNPIAILLILILIAGCGPSRRAPQKTSLELQAFQAKEFQTTKKVAYGAVFSVFQDLGYQIKTADFETGFITAESSAQRERFFKFGVGFGFKSNFARATAFIEEITQERTKIRLNFSEHEDRSTVAGMTDAEDVPVLDPKIYQNAFTRIEEAIFIRSATQ